MDKGPVLKQVIDRQDIANRVSLLGEQLSREFSQRESLSVLVVMNGAFMFAADLVRRLAVPHIEMGFVQVQSYCGCDRCETVQLIRPVSIDLSGKDVLLVDDIVDSGNTVRFLTKHLESECQPRSITVVSLLKRAQQPPVDELDYSCFVMGQGFFVGYGLDMDGSLRNLPDISVMIPSEDDEGVSVDS